MSGLTGGLDLIAAPDAAGRTILRKQSFSPPIHISKPHHDAGWLVVNLASPSPGLLAGDRVTVNVTVETGARLLLTAPSANRIHNTGDASAELTQSFTVHSGACLDVWPEYLIPQAGARYLQRTTLRVAQGSTLLWTEMVAPGRTARGESFAFTELRLATDLIRGNDPLVRERYCLDPGSAGAARAEFPNLYYASLLCVSPQLPDARAALRALTEASRPREARLGATQIAPDAWAIKVIAADSPALRAQVAAIRATLYAILSCPEPRLRRITGETSNSLATKAAASV